MSGSSEKSPQSNNNAGDPLVAAAAAAASFQYPPMGYYPSSYYPPHGIPCMSPYMRATNVPSSHPNTQAGGGFPLAQLLSPSPLMNYVSLYPYGGNTNSSPQGGVDQYFQTTSSSSSCAAPASNYPMGYSMYMPPPAEPQYMMQREVGESRNVSGGSSLSYRGGHSYGSYAMDENPRQYRSVSTNIVRPPPTGPKQHGKGYFYSTGKENNAPSSNQYMSKVRSNTDICKGIESMNLNNGSKPRSVPVVVPKLRVVKLDNVVIPYQSTSSATSTTSGVEKEGGTIRLTSPSTDKTSLCNMSTATARSFLTNCKGGSTISLPAPIPSGLTQSPAQVLEEALKNPRGTTNVYIRGLVPETTDESLYDLAANFGRIRTAKAMIDTNTGYCKGFGFAEFESQEEAAICIKTLTLSGYQSSFAKQSFALRLKDLHDPASTNVYFSNLSKSMTEEDMEKMIRPFEVVSIRILRDNMGQSRGVGFARLVSRESAEEIIKMHNGRCICGGGPIQVRFSDTNAQKTLKQQTAKKRSWRAQEYRMMTSHLTNIDTISEQEDGDTEHDSQDKVDCNQGQEEEEEEDDVDESDDTQEIVVGHQSQE